MLVRTLGTVLAALALAVAAVACGGDDDDSSSPATATRAPATTASGGASSSGSSPAAGATTAASPAASRSAANAVSIVDNSFSPGTLAVTKGTKVTWTWSGNNPHSVVGKTADGKDVKSPTQSSGTFEFTFDVPGTFQYQCGVHGAAMTGTITVQ